MSTIQSMAARARRECDTSGLPAGEYTYSDPLKIENRYQSEASDICDQYGTIANWNAWERVKVRERATGRTVFDSEVKKITGWPLTYAPAAVIELLDQSIYEVTIL